MARYRNTDFKDCRINAYPYNDKIIDDKIDDRYNNKIPNLLFIDLDKSAFKTELGLKRGLKTTLDNIKNYLRGVPTVLFTGNGFHVYQPITAINLEDIANFNDVSDSNNKFLRFAARYLSNNKSDLNNYQSVKSCMLRVPDSINSKNNSIVKIVQRWDGIRPDFNLLLGSFYAATISDKIKYKRNRNNYNKNYNSNSLDKNQVITPSYYWIDNLLKLPLADGRKTSISLILSPYLMNIKRLSYEKSHSIIINWLNSCSLLQRLSFNPNSFTKSALLYAVNNGYKPLKFENLKGRNRDLYYHIKNKN